MNPVTERARALNKSRIVQEQTLARLSIPMLASEPSPRASIRIDSADFAARTREILPLNLGAACPIKEA